MVTTQDSLICLHGVSRIFTMGDVQVPALVDVDVSIDIGQFVVVLGPSGSGKSTLLNIIGGIDRPTSGQALVDAQDLTNLSDEELTAFRRQHIGFIFQFYNLIPTLTAQENVQAATELVQAPVAPTDALAMVDLQDRVEHFPAQLSGGEQQRVAIARALAKKPRILLADEPTGALDLPAARSVLGILQRLNREQRLTVILITHNPAIARIANRVIRLVSGRVAESRTNDEILPAEQVSW